MTNQIGIAYGYWTPTWEADFSLLAARAGRLGFDILEVNAPSVAAMSGAERDRFGNALADAGVGLSFCMGLPEQMDIGSEDTSVRSAGVAYLRAMLQAAAETGARSLSGVVYGPWSARYPDGVTDKQGVLARSIECSREVVKTAEDVGVYLDVEPLNRYEQFLLNTAAEAREYVTHVDSDFCRIVLDTYHLNIEEDSFAGAIRTAGEKLGQFHLAETNRKVAGRGKIPWDDVFRALAEIDFRGAYVMEPFVIPAGEIGRAMRINRGDPAPAPEDLDADLAESLWFVRNKIAGALLL